MARSTRSDRRKLVLLTAAVVYFAANLTVQAKEPEWFTKFTQIKILKATRNDVERLFSDSKVVDRVDYTKEKDGWGQEIEYSTKDGYLEVEYSTGTCPVRRGLLAYDVPPDIVVEVRFFPNNEILLKEFGLDTSEFQRETIDDISDSFVLRDREGGRKIVLKSGKLSSIEFTPGKAHSSLVCEQSN